MDDSVVEESIRALVIDHPARAAAVAAVETFRLIDPADWEGSAVPIRAWAWRDWMPAGSATYLTGAGSAGKSLLAQQLATHVALGRSFLGAEVQPAVALYLTCEDDPDELHRRQDAICDSLNMGFSGLHERLHLVSLVGAPGNEIATFDLSNRMETTPSWDRLIATVKAIRAGLVVLDNVAHLFAGNENIRAHVAAFCSLMNRLAAEAEGAVLFIGHPNKAGDSFSGSTAWENQVRSRLFLERPKAAEGEPYDPDVRLLSRGKANYAPLGEAVRFRWYRGAFVVPEDLPPDEARAITTTVRLRSEEERFLTCLEKTTAERRAVSPSRNASSYAPRIFAAMPSAAGMHATAFAGAMERLLDQGAILAEQRVYQRPNRVWVTGLGPAPRSAPTPAPSDAHQRTKADGEP